MSLPIVIINPQSAGGATGKAWPKIASELNQHFGSFKPEFTSTSGEAVQIAADAARKGARLIIACGGDGTVSEVANGILSSGKAAELGILPSGTGGDFRRTLKIPARAADAAKILHDGRTRLLDVVSVTFTNRTGEHDTRYFLGVASFGMSADVIARVKAGDKSKQPLKLPKWVTGRLAFGKAMAETALKSKPTRVVVQLDDDIERHMTVANLCIANARYFGGGMKIAPDAKLDDGKLDVISIGDIGAARILANAPRLYLGAHLGIPEVGHALARKVTARALNPEHQIELELDGELPSYLPATFQIVPGALRVRCP